MQSDGTAWVAQMVISMAQMSLELSRHAHGWGNDIEKMLLDFAIVANAIESGRDGVSLWNEEAGFYCDAIVRPEGGATQLGVISMQAIIPMLACAVIPISGQHMANGLQLGPEATSCASGCWSTIRSSRQHRADAEHGDGTAMLFTVVPPGRLRRILEHVLNPIEMLSGTGCAACRRCTATIRTPSPWATRPSRCPTGPPSPATACSAATPTGAGRSGSLINVMIVQTLAAYDAFFGDTFAIEYPSDSGQEVSLPTWPPTWPSGSPASSCAARTASGWCSATTTTSGTTRTGRTSCPSTSTSTATTATGSAPATRPAGPPRWRSCCSSSTWSTSGTSVG